MKKSNLTKPERKVASKVMSKHGYSTREVEAWLGVDHVTASRYVKEATPEGLELFETEFKAAVEKKKQEGLGMIIKRIHEIIPKYPRMDHLVKAGEYFEGVKRGGDVNVQVVIPILGKEQEVK